jgi:D-tyrosyl-tRNA(Tyr) deacylase
MRAVIQRVLQASVKIDDKIKAEIEQGLLIFLGIEDNDNTEDMECLSNKIINLRIFDDEQKVPNLSIKQIDGNVLLISQFTLFASTKKGNRPSYIAAGKPEYALNMYNKMIAQLEKDLDKKIYTGKFGADMKVSLINNGPITIYIDTKNKE